MKYEPIRQPAEISVETACRQKQIEHDEIRQLTDDFLSSGGSIQVIPRGVSGTQDGLFGYTARHLNKKQKAAQRKLYDESTADETEE